MSTTSNICAVCGTYTPHSDLSWGVCSVCVAECSIQAKAAQRRAMAEQDTTNVRLLVVFRHADRQCACGNGKPADRQIPLEGKRFAMCSKCAAHYKTHPAELVRIARLIE
jgi:hypothetical protein